MGWGRNSYWRGSIGIAAALIGGVALGLAADSMAQSSQSQVANARHGSAQSAEAGRSLVRVVDQAIIRLTGDLSPPQRIQELHRLLKEHVDLPALGRFALGRYWRSASDRDRADFLTLFEELIVRTSEAGLDDFTGDALHLTETRDADDEFIVRSALTIREGRTVQIDWRLDNDLARLRIQDIVVEGISVRVMLRDYFAAAIQERGGMPTSLLSVMHEMVHLPAREWK